MALQRNLRKLKHPRALDLSHVDGLAVLPNQGLVVLMCESGNLLLVLELWTLKPVGKVLSPLLPSPRSVSVPLPREEYYITLKPFTHIY